VESAGGGCAAGESFPLLQETREMISRTIPPKTKRFIITMF
jgi:hypothetical protein